MKYDSDRAYWRQWFPADFITESFPGQFRNWFYSMLAMSTVLENTNPFRTVLGYALLRDQHGREMHKSWGNAIPFDEAADRVGADVMRWLFCLHNPEANLNFGWEALDEVKRRLLVFWNTYSFFVTYANVDGWTPQQGSASRPALLDRWILARLHSLIREVRTNLQDYDAMGPARGIEAFMEDLSTWYVRRSRRRFWKSENDDDKSAAYATLYDCLETLTRLLAPFMPFLAESLYQNLVRQVDPAAPVSVHLTDYPVARDVLIDEDLLAAMASAKQVVALGRAARDRSGIKVRQPLARMFVGVPGEKASQDILQLRDIILDELNVKELEFAGAEDEFVAYSVKPDLPRLGPRFGKQLPAIRSALAALDPAQVARLVQEDQPVLLPLNGSTVELTPEEVQVTAREREGYAAMAADGFLVALDTSLTPDLIHEGWARDVVRRINDWRRTAGFSVEDRIRIRYQATPALASAIQSFADYIARETLATSLEPAELSGSGYQAEARIGDELLQVELERSTAQRTPEHPPHPAS
jgi:isoleucyl-tRNA synthetase